MAKLLLVEDDPLMQDMYKSILELEEGFLVMLASNGEEALEKLKDFLPDLILLDIMMPKMNGLDALKNIKERPNLVKIPVIMLTNIADQNMVEKAMALGASKYLVKSNIAPDALTQVIKQLLENTAS